MDNFYILFFIIDDEYNIGDNRCFYCFIGLVNFKVILVDIVLVVLEIIKMVEGFDFVFLDFIKFLKKRFIDINIGVFIFGSKNIINFY